MSTNGVQTQDRPRLRDAQAIRITSAELAKNGPAVRDALNSVYGGELDTHTTNLLYRDLVSGEMVGWALVAHGENGKRHLAGILLGRVADDPMLGRHLYLPALTMSAAISLDEYRRILETVLDYARQQGCQDLWYQTDSKAAKRLGEALGFAPHSVVLRRSVNHG